MQKYILSCGPAGSPRNIDYQKDLNPEQYNVVTQAHGPCLVLAGPGSGKTRTLIYRIAYILEKGMPAQNILLMTFTNKASHEMQNRLEYLLKAKPTGLWCGTFHHIGNRSLRMYAKHLGLNEEFGIMDEEDQKAMIKICTKSLKTDATAAKLFPSAGVIQTIISYSRNSKQEIEKTIFDKYPYLSNFTEEITGIARLYAQKKKGSNNLDYDDLLSEWIRLLETVPSARERFTQQFRYILVDEYQDTNKLQFDIIRLLCAHHGNLLVVGDDAQSIYSFRAADIKNILEFPSRFEGTRIFKLQTNYRSTASVLDLANNIIQKNNNQFDKKIISARSDLPGEKPKIIYVNDHYTQSAFISQRICELNKEGVPLNEIAVLYRAHYQSVELELELIKREIPYVIRGGIRFFEQAHIKDVLAFLKIVQNPQDELSWLRALSLQAGIGGSYADKVFQKFIKGGLSVRDTLSRDFSSVLPRRATDGFNGFCRIIKPLLKNDLLAHPDAMIHEILNNGYKDHVLSNFDNGRDRLDDINELSNFAHTYKDLKEFLADVTLREGFKGETIIQPPESADNHIILSTIHQAKGLEWKTVFIIGLSDGQFPHPKSMEDTVQFEEERRLFYVAVTRAKDKVYLVHSMTRFDYNYGSVISRPSLFLQEIPEEYLEKWEIEQDTQRYDDPQ